MKNLFKVNLISHLFSSKNIKIVSFAISLSLPLTYSQMALSAVDDLGVDKVSVKCHVLLMGGNEIISLWYVQQKKLKQLKDTIIGKKILTAESKQKIKIYQAYECVLDSDDFKSSKARLLDTETPR